MRYSQLTKEQFEELHEEFALFLATQKIDIKEWEDIKKNNPEVADEELNLFSDLVWEKVLGKSKYLEHFSKDSINLFKCEEEGISRIVVKSTVPNFDFTKSLNDKFELFYGAEFWYNLIGSKANIKNIENGSTQAISTRYPDGSDYLNGGVYAMASWKISDKVNINGGLRYNIIYMQGVFDTTYYAFPEAAFDQTNQALSPSVGFVYRPNEKYRIQVNAGQGFRAANIDDVAKVFDSSPGNVVVPNTSLSPEKVWSFDMGYTWMPVSKFQFEVSGFYSLLSDVMVRSAYSFNGQDSIIYDGELSKVEAIQNLGNGWIAGVESSIRASISTHYSLRANIVYTKGEDGNKDPLRHVTH